MTTRRQFVVILLSVVALSSLASHAVIRLLGVVTVATPFPDSGSNFQATPIVAAGSSLINYGLEWDRVANEFSRPVKILTTPAASPCELEILLANAPKTDFTLLGIAVSDMDEDVISDFRADVVPFTQTWHDLRESRADESLRRRTLGQYPLRYLRVLFPTAGRSMGLLVGLRKVARDLVHRHGASTAEPLPTFNNAMVWPTNRISDWDAGRRLRNTEQQRTLSADRHSFAGPKRRALERMLRLALTRGQAVVVVMPESPIYDRDVIDPSVKKAFAAEVEDVAARFPAVKWIRLDRLNELHSNELYWDLVHLNAAGRPMATAALIQQLKPWLRQ
jgi:hypothetical protein